MASGKSNAHLTISLLGTFRVTVDGEIVTAFHADTARALLTYLAMHPQTNHRRDALAGLLWPEQTNAKALRNLRMALSRVRTVLRDREAAPPYLTITRQTIALRDDPRITVDVAMMRKALTATETHDHPSLTRCGTCAAKLQQVANLYKGEFLDGFALNSVSFEAWVVVEREHLHWSALEALQALTAYHEGAGDYDAALAFARRQVDLEPWREVAHRQWMRALALGGHRNAALAQFKTCRDILAEELGVEPEAETLALYEQIRSGALTPPPVPEKHRKADLTPPPEPDIIKTPAPSVPSETRALTLPLLGRERQLHTLTEHVERAARGDGRTVLVAGEAGIGKTRLVASFLQKVTDQTGPRPVRALVGRGYALESRAAYTLWADALHDLVHPAWQRLLAGLDAVWVQQLARLVPDLSRPHGNDRSDDDYLDGDGHHYDDTVGITPEESRLRLMHSVVQTLHHLTQSCVLCLWFDDLHWADEASLSLLHYVARHTTQQPLLIIGTYRTNAVPGNEHLTQIIQATPPETRIALPPLDRDTVGQLMLHAGLSKQGYLDRLYQHSEGNALFVVETLNTLQTSRHLPQTNDGIGQNHAAEENDTFAAGESVWPVPQRISNMVQTRIQTLDEPARRVLDAAAVIGRAHGLRLLSRISGLSELAVTTAVTAAQQRGLLQEHPNESPRANLSFHHTYVQRAVYEGLSVIRRQTLHRRAARALLETHRVRPQAVSEEVAHHFEQAGDAQAIPFLQEAAEQATALYSYRHATALTTRALACLDRFEPHNPIARFDLLMARETLLHRLGRRSDQADDVAALRQLAEELNDTGRMAQANIRQAGWLSVTGDYAGAREAGEQALILYRADNNREGEGQALRELGFMSWTSGDYSSALAYVRDALKLHRRQGNVAGEATALHNLAEIHRSLGSPRQALAQYQNAINLYWARQEQRRQGLTRYGMANALRQLDDLAAATTHYHRALEHFETAGDRLMMSRTHHTLAGLHWQAGNVPAAQEHMEQALAISRNIGYGLGIAYGLVSLSDLLAQQSKWDKAQGHLEEATTWLRLIEDTSGLGNIQTRLQALKRGEIPEIVDLKPPGGWIKSHITLAEGKVYCAFESPMAQQVLSAPQIVDVSPSSTSSPRH